MATKKTTKPKTKPKAEAAIQSDLAVIDTTPKKSKKTAIEPRRFTPASFKKRRLRRKAERAIARTYVPNSIVIFSRGFGILRNNWEIFGGILLIYTLINLVLGGISGGQELQDAKENLGQLFTGHINRATTGLGIFAFLIYNGTGATSGASQMFQTFIIIMFSLAFVWALRQAYANNKVRIRDAFYNSSYPLVQVILVLLMICLHLVPAVVGAFLFQSLVNDGILVVLWQKYLAGFITFLLVSWSFYLLSHSVMALYIATLPDMTPLGALRSAKEIVKHRRGMVLRKLLMLPFILLLVAVVIMVPLAAFFTSFAAMIYFLLTMISLPLIHAYLYTLYRELIK